jgi:hypothetical protein
MGHGSVFIAPINQLDQTTGFSIIFQLHATLLSYVRVGCPILVQETAIRAQLCN